MLRHDGGRLHQQPKDPGYIWLGLGCAVWHLSKQLRRISPKNAWECICDFEAVFRGTEGSKFRSRRPFEGILKPLDSFGGRLAESPRLGGSAWTAFAQTRARTCGSRGPNGAVCQQAATSPVRRRRRHLLMIRYVKVTKVVGLEEKKRMCAELAR